TELPAERLVGNFGGEAFQGHGDEVFTRGDRHFRTVREDRVKRFGADLSKQVKKQARSSGVHSLLPVFRKTVFVFLSNTQVTARIPRVSARRIEYGFFETHVPGNVYCGPWPRGGFSSVDSPARPFSSSRSVSARKAARGIGLLT